MPSELAELTREAIEEARVRYPEVQVDVDRLTRHLAERLGGADVGGLERRHLPELVLSLAAAGGDELAITRVESDHFGGVAFGLRRLRLDPATAEEIIQLLRVQLFVAAPDRPARIADYSGRGDLRRWLGVVATRVALDFLRAHRREIEAPDQFLAELADPRDDQEVAYLKQKYRRELRSAVSSALARLAPDDRALLRSALLGRRTLEQLADAEGVHRATVARRLARARESLRKHARSAFSARLRVEPAELESIGRLIESQLDVSLSGLFRSS